MSVLFVTNQLLLPNQINHYYTCMSSRYSRQQVCRFS